MTALRTKTSLFFAGAAALGLAGAANAESMMNFDLDLPDPAVQWRTCERRARWQRLKHVWPTPSRTFDIFSTSVDPFGAMFDIQYRFGFFSQDPNGSGNTSIDGDGTNSRFGVSNSGRNAHSA